MLCSLLKIWNTYTIANALFPGYGKTYSTPSNEPVAMTMGLRHSEVTIVNQKEYIKCFTTQVADKFNAAIINIAPDMYKFTTSMNKDVLDHYVFYDKNADIRMPSKVEESKIEKILTQTINQFVSNSKNDTHSLTHNIISKNIGTTIHTNEKNIEDIIDRIVKNEYKLSRNDNEPVINQTSQTILRKTLKKSIKNLVKKVIKAHHHSITINRKVNTVLSVIKKEKSPIKKIRTVKKILKSILKMNSLRSLTPKKIKNILTISRSYPPLIARRKIKNIVHSIIRTHSNRELSKHMIRKMVEYVRKNSGEISEKKIKSKLKRMMTTIINTTVSTIIPNNKVAKIISLSKHYTPTEFSKKVRSIVHDIRVDEDKETEDFTMNQKCPVCQCNFRKTQKKVKRVKKNVENIVKEAMLLTPTKIPQLVPLSRSSVSRIEPITNSSKEKVLYPKKKLFFQN